ncbi:phage tail protein [Pseudoalteromonas obscura]|uniref:Phage tail protein n=1 Tax=Pseudoalteromonas obscura TaxID=3048491 RepID=A0ABT7EHX0_9GAMM|nr:phage tail protein [Pseudoalteromonas sp. P94(2023)]MDK2594650.1 phage tail protein [Pseudoalteromonas sp. P94(2023)]
MSHHLDTDSDVLLPYNHSTLQEAIVKHGQLESVLGEGIQLLRGFKSHPKQSLLPWLIWEYGLGALVPYLDDLDQVLQQGLAWQRIRGTRKSLEMAYGWLGFSIADVEESRSYRHFYRYQCHLEQLPILNDAERMAQLAELSAPARSELTRITYKLDIRDLTLSAKPFGTLLSDHSGFRHRLKNGKLLRISTRRTHPHQFSFDGEAASGLNRKHNSFWQSCTSQVLGILRLSESVACQFSAASTHSRKTSRTYSLGQAQWFGYWQASTWSATSSPQVVIAHQGHR